MHTLYKLAKKFKDPEVSSSQEKPDNEDIVSESYHIQTTCPAVNDWVADIYD